MNGLVWLTVASGAAATTFTLLALIAARRHKQGLAQTTVFLTLFWGSVCAYMASFTALRLAYTLEAADAVLDGLYYAQTVAGASTVISLAAIMFGAVLRPWWSGFVTGLFVGLAGLTLSLIFGPGFDIVVRDAWSIEILPNAIAGRIMVALVYVLMPVAMTLLVMISSRKADDATRFRFASFGASVVLMYIPNAIKYVFIFEGASNLILAIVMTVGTFIGWRGYLEPRAARTASNG